MNNPIIQKIFTTPFTIVLAVTTLFTMLLIMIGTVLFLLPEPPIGATLESNQAVALFLQHHPNALTELHTGGTTATLYATEDRLLYLSVNATAEIPAELHCVTRDTSRTNGPVDPVFSTSSYKTMAEYLSDNTCIQG